MTANYILLGILWLLYGFLHSALASEGWKRFMKAIMKSNFILYRIFYILFAFVFLAGIIFYQVNLPVIILFKKTLSIIFLGYLMTATGAIIMMICVKKYFLNLSGLRSLFEKRMTHKLIITGIHKYVRHPLYLGTFIFLWGLFLLYPYLSLFIADFIITIYTLIGIRFEEEKLILEYGEDYKQYQLKVPMLLPGFKTGRFI